MKFSIIVAQSLFLTAACLVTAGLQAAEETAPIDFARDVMPILEAHCVDCHGSDQHESGLRLDSAGWAHRGGDRGLTIVPGKSGKSVLFQAILGQGDVTAMPVDAEKLDPEQIGVIRRWIDEGAVIPGDEPEISTSVESDHWAFQPVQRLVPPTVNRVDWVHTPIDHFVLARLEQEGLAPANEADRVTLIRRLSLDLLGLLPTIDEVDQFLADDKPGAYERLVDRMLASPHYGERWGRHWLDIARYADSNGFTIDGPRSIWKYRDWVIDAWNRDLSFDRFTIEQLAGDLLPKAGLDQRIATGFHRNTLINQEGGTDDEQFRVESVVDRVNTTGAVFLGLTIGCARCHEHKFDPISQREYYELFAVFNNCDEPNIQVPTSRQAAKLEKLRAEIAAVEKPLKAHDDDFLQHMPDWEQMLHTEMSASWLSLDPHEMLTDKGSVLTKRDDRSVFVDFSSPPNDVFTLVADVAMPRITAIRLEALTHPSLPKMGPGRAPNGNFVLSEFEVSAAPVGSAKSESASPATVRIAKAVADHSQVGYPAGDAIDGNQKSGWSIGIKSGSLNVNREAVFLLAEPIQFESGARLTVKLHQNHSEAAYLLGRFRLSVSSANPKALETPASIRAILAIDSEKRSEAQEKQLVAAYRGTDDERKPLATKLGELKKREQELVKSIPTTMVLRDREKPRTTHIHVRGDFLRKGAAVRGSVPSVLPGFSTSNDEMTRLDLAHWLVDDTNPLTARVTVNRFWQRFFGLGLVDTENDFGTQGSLPTHPKLLDWLADEFQRLGWSMKAMHRRIVTSATYRQSSAVAVEQLNQDPANRLLARQSRLRVEAETIRDICLSASDLLSNKMFGAGVYPPQPEGIYVVTQIKKVWPESRDEDRYRRGMYTFFWRSRPYPFLPTFDAPDANTTCTRRPRSNTPLQALTLANDRAFVDLARGLASRILNDGPSDLSGRIRYAFRLCVSRQPTDTELERLTEFYATQQRAFEGYEQEAESAAPENRAENGSTSEAMAWTALARVLLNLDEFITRE